MSQAIRADSVCPLSAGAAKSAKAGDHLHCSQCAVTLAKARAIPGISAPSLAFALTLAM